MHLPPVSVEPSLSRMLELLEASIGSLPSFFKAHGWLIKKVAEQRWSSFQECIGLLWTEKNRAQGFGCTMPFVKLSTSGQPIHFYSVFFRKHYADVSSSGCDWPLVDDCSQNGACLRQFYPLSYWMLFCETCFFKSPCCPAAGWGASKVWPTNSFV